MKDKLVDSTFAPAGYRAILPPKDAVTHCGLCAFVNEGRCDGGRPCLAHERPDGCTVYFVSNKGTEEDHALFKISVADPYHEYTYEVVLSADESIRDVAKKIFHALGVEPVEGIPRDNRIPLKNWRMQDEIMA